MKASLSVLVGNDEDNYLHHQHLHLMLGRVWSATSRAGPEDDVVLIVQIIKFIPEEYEQD